MKYFNVYTDGSFGEDGLTHGGIVFVKSDNSEVLSVSHVQTRVREFVSMRNVGGEVLAAWAAIFAVANSVKESNETNGLETYQLNLTYDYEGVGKWLNGQWKCKKHATQWYRDSIKAILATVPNLTLNLIWVRGHMGNEYNEVADRVASYDKSTRYPNTDICDMDELLRTDYGFM